MVIILRRSEVLLPRYGRKIFLCLLWNRFYDINRSFISTLVVILHRSEILFLRFLQKCYFAGFTTSFRVIAVLLRALWWLFCVDLRYRWQDTGENISSPVLKPVFMPFTLLHWELWWLFCLDSRYLCQDTGENVFWPALKPLLWHSPFFFEHFCCSFDSIRGTLFKTRVNKFLHRLLNGL